MEREERDGRVYGLATLGAQSHDLQSGLVDLLCQLVDGDVGRCTHEHWRTGLFHQVVDDRRRGDRLPSARRALEDIYTVSDLMFML